MNNATDQREIVLMNRKMNVDRAVTGRGGVCSIVTAMDCHHSQPCGFVHRFRHEEYPTWNPADPRIV